jgi:Zn-dependent protease with chaperone function
MTFDLAGSLVIKITLLLALALLIDEPLRRRWVLAAGSFWNAVLLALVVLPLAAGLTPRLTLPLLPAASRMDRGATMADRSQTIATDPRAATTELPPFVPMATAVPKGVSLWSAAVLVYGCGVSLGLAQLLAGWHGARALRRAAMPVTDRRWLERLDFWTGRLGNTGNRSTEWPRQMQLLASDQIDVPIALGVVRPAILIPLHLLEASTPQAVDAILVHELAHVYRADCAWQLLGRVLQAALWLHPLMWLAQKRISFVRERACDDFAVRMVGDFRVYGETLLDVAARITRRRSVGLGLTIVRSSKLERRLAAISERDGTDRCLAATSTRCLITAGMLLCAVAFACLGLSRATAEELELPDPQGSAPAAAPSPELIALTWQLVPQSDNKRIEGPVWRPDGTLLTNTESNALLDKVKSFQTHWWNTEKDLRPLVLIYRASSKIRTGFSTAIVLPDGRRQWGGSYWWVQDGLSKSACSPSRDDLASWPVMVDLELQVPLEDPQVIRTIKSVPEGAVEIAPGVRWHTAKKEGTDFLSPGMPPWPYDSGVLEVQKDRIDSPVKYGATIWLRGRKQPVAEGLRMTFGPKPDELTSVRLSAQISDLQSIERVEFTRQRFGLERIKDVEIRLDLLPPAP